MRLRPLLLLLSTALVLDAVTTSTASATVARVVTSEESEDSGGFDREDVYVDVYTLRVAANPHERNRVRIRVLDGEQISVEDPGSRRGLHVGPGCVKRSKTRAVCSADDGFGDIEVATKDGRDTLSATGGSSLMPLDATLGTGPDRARVGFAAHIDGGGGNDDIATLGGEDTLLGGPGDDALDGGRGNDVVAGGTGRDRMRGGPGRDALLAYDGRGVVPDSINGGSGADTVLYGPRRKGVRIVLGAGGHSGGAVREDRYTSIESAVGGRGDDRVTGDSGATRLSGGDGGHDVVTGRGGADTLVLGAGDDRALGGDGADLIDGTDAGGEADCGAGRDVVAASAAVLVRPSCEAVGTAYTPAADRSTPTPVGATADALRFDVACGATTCPHWRFTLRRAAAGPAWAGAGPATTTPIVSVPLPQATQGQHVTAVVPRTAATLPAGLPVTAAIETLYPGSTVTFDQLAWGLLVP
jgi:hypothetical protein